MKKNIVLTREKIEELEKELKELEGSKKKELSKSLEQARLSDVSEDTDDIIAVMNEIQKVEQRITEIKDLLSVATVLDKKDCAPNKVVVGSKVEVLNNGKKIKYDIVSEVESDPGKNKISDKSPLGKALLRAKTGDKLKIKIADREVQYEVLSIC